MDFTTDTFEFDLRNEKIIVLTIKRCARKLEDDLDDIDSFVNTLWEELARTPFCWGDDVYVDMYSHFNPGVTLLYTLDSLDRYFNGPGQQDGLDQYRNTEDWLEHDTECYRNIYNVIDNSEDIEPIIKDALYNSVVNQLLKGQ